MPYEGEMVRGVRRRLRRLRRAVEKSEALDDAGRLGNHVKEMEMERLAYGLGVYLRVRLGKVFRYYAHLTHDEGAAAVLAKHEQTALRDYRESAEKALREGCVDALPDMPEVRDLYSREEVMIERPDESKHVFARAAEDLGHVELQDDVDVEWGEGDIYLLPFNLARPFVVEGKVALL